MALIFLVIIYIIFISLGLPDSILGSAWSVMHTDLNVTLASAGIISIIVTGGSIVSSFLSGKLIKRFGTGKLVFVSVAMTAFALLGFFAVKTFFLLCLLAVPLGLGAGAVDASLNNFVALNYKSRHMSWLHCFWGVGATIGPIIMAFFIKRNNEWRNGYFTIATIQIVISIIIFLTLPYWKKFESEIKENKENLVTHSDINLFKMPAVKSTLIAFFCYIAVESSVGLWGSSYLVKYKGAPNDVAARSIAMFFVGITLGRFISGIATEKFSNRTLIRVGQELIVIGAIIIMCPTPLLFSIVGLFFIGFGCAPVFPCMLQETPKKFGKEASQSIMGYQMAFAYMGGIFMPPLMGVIASKLSFVIFPFLIIIYALIMIFCSENSNKILSKNQSSN